MPQNIPSFTSESKDILSDIESLREILKRNGIVDISFSPEKAPEYLGLLLRDIAQEILKFGGIEFKFDSGGSNVYPALSIYNRFTEKLFNDLEKYYKVEFRYLNIDSELSVDNKNITQSIDFLEKEAHDVAKIIFDSLSSSLKKNNTDIYLNKQEIESEIVRILPGYFLLHFEKKQDLSGKMKEISRKVKNML